MPITFVEAVDKTLKRVGVLQTATTNLAQGTGTASELFVQSQNQHSIDLVTDLWEDAIQTVYSMALAPTVVATATITLVANQREYALPEDFERVAGLSYEERVLRAATKLWVAFEYPGGYLKMLADQGVASDWSGAPLGWAINPASTATAIQIRLDRDPDDGVASDTYNIAYEQTMEMTTTMATSLMPFSDTVTNALVGVVSESYESIKKKEFNRTLFEEHLSRALKMVRPVSMNRRWGTRRGTSTIVTGWPWSVFRGS